MNLNEIAKRKTQLKEERISILDQLKAEELALKERKQKLLGDIDEEIAELDKKAIDMMNTLGVSSVNTEGGKLTMMKYNSAKASSWKKTFSGVMKTREVLSKVEENAPQYVYTEEVKKLDEKAIKDDLASGKLQVVGQGQIIDTETGSIVSDEQLFAVKETALSLGNEVK